MVLAAGMARLGRRAAITVGAALLVAYTAAGASAADVNWNQFGGDAAHSGNNPAETTLGTGNVARLTSTFTAALPGVADAPPAYQAGVATASGTRNLLFLTTRDGALVAMDASSGGTVWSHTVGPGTCTINHGSTPCYTTSAPAVDPSGAYVYSYGLDGRVHKYATGTGAETIGGGWPEVATTKGYDEKGSSGLTIARSHGTSYLYVAIAGYPGDQGDYQGHVTTINLATGGQQVFNTLCSDQAVHFTASAPDCSHVLGAVWSRGSVAYDSQTDRVLLVTGNGDFNPGNHDWGDTVLAIRPDGTGVAGGPVDSYTPANYQALDDQDQDLGSTAPALLKSPAGSTVSDLGVQSGKDGKLRLLNLANLSGSGGPGHVGGELQVLDVPQGGAVFTQPTTWTNPADGSSWFFVANGRGLAALKLTVQAGKPQMQTVWTTADGGTTPVIADNVLYYLTNSGAKAINPANHVTLWNDPTGTVGLHWQSPIVANGSLYYPDGSGHVRAFGLPTAPATSGPITGIASKCLDDAGGGTANGNPIDLSDCTGNAAQRWTVGADGSISVLGKCLDDYQSGTANGNKIQLYTCNGTAAQRWTVGADGTIQVLGKCLDDYHSGTANGNRIQLYACNGTPAQRWRTP